MKLRLTALLALCLTTQVTLAKDAVTAPAGLGWGLSEKDLASMNVSLSNCKDLGIANVKYCTASNVPKPLSFAESYTLYFIGGKLLKTRIIGKTISGDIYGTEGKASFDRLLNALKKKYTVKDFSHKQYIYIGQKLYDEVDEFYQCLAYDGCGKHALYMLPEEGKNGKGAVVLELNGLSRGKGYLDVIHEAPLWGEELGKAKEAQNEVDLDGL